MATQRQLPRSATLRIIRIALLSGVLMFGGVAYYLVQKNGPLGAENAGALQIVNIVLLVGAAVGIMIIQRRHLAERDPAKRSTLNIVAWAMGEATALFGGVHFLMIGNPVPFLVGLVMMIAAFVVVPIRE
jgi:branched-subunit amino acid ABC-type transport system permease component